MSDLSLDLETPGIKEYVSFEDMGLSDDLLRGIYGYGYETPSVIQQKAIVLLKEGNDLIAQSQSGTGKTAAFVLGSYSRIDKHLKETQVIVMSPTRELAIQTLEVYRALGAHTKIIPALCIGKTSMAENFIALENDCRIVVGTPGRIYDLLNKKKILPDFVATVILDEADVLLSDGFDIKEIIQLIPKGTQIGIFTATMTSETLNIAERFMNKPIKILIKPDKMTLEGIAQFNIDVETEKNKFDTFLDICGLIKMNQIIVYVNSIVKAEQLYDDIKKNNFSISLIHGKMDPRDRMVVMEDFRLGKAKILLSTDLLARGIDIQQVSVVINYDIPRSDEACEIYLHRIGRSGRFGRKGMAINFVTTPDIRTIKYIETTYSIEIKPLPVEFAEYVA